MRVARWVLFLLCFQLEISVRAESSVVAAAEQTVVVTSAFETMFVLPHGLLDQTAEGQRRVIAGTVFVRAAKEAQATLVSFYGFLKTSGEMTVLAKEKSDRILVRAIKETVVIGLRDGRTLSLAEGMQIEIGAVTSAGTNYHGLPTTIEIADHLRVLALLPGAGRESMKAESIELKARWKNAAASAGELYQAVIARHVASVREADDVKKRQQQVEEAKRAEFRRLLMKKAFEE